MATVTAAFARNLARAAGYGVTDNGEILSGDTVAYHAPLDETDRLSVETYFAMIDWVCRYHPDRTALAFAYAEHLDMDELGVLGLAVKTAPTLRESLIRVERYFRLMTDTVQYHLEVDADVGRFVIEPRTDPHPIITFRNECALLGFAVNLKRLGGDGLAFERITFRHACPSDPMRYAEPLGCPVVFEADQDAIIIGHDMLELPNRLGDAGVSNFLTQHLDNALDALQPRLTLTDEVQRLLSTSLSTGVPSAADTARRLGMSERTFFRRLSDEGQTYQGVLRQAQQALAKDPLGTADCSIAEIAFLTGFAEQSTFSRAFKRWVGTTPARYRDQSAQV